MTSSRWVRQWGLQIVPIWVSICVWAIPYMYGTAHAEGPATGNFFNVIRNHAESWLDSLIRFLADSYCQIRMKDICALKFTRIMVIIVKVLIPDSGIALIPLVIPLNSQSHQRDSESCRALWPMYAYAFVGSPHTATNINKLKSVHRHATRYVMSDYERHSSVSYMISTLNWKSLKQIREETFNLYVHFIKY